MPLSTSRVPGDTITAADVNSIAGEVNRAQVPAWVTGRAYVLNELVIEAGTLYRVSTAHTSAGSFDSSKFTAVGANVSVDADGTLVVGATTVEVATDAQLTAHEAAADPHTGYLTEAAATATYVAKGDLVFDVLDYGADPTGVADSAPAFRAALAAADAAGGGTVLAPRGTYLMDSKLPAIPNVVLNGPTLSMEGMSNISLDGYGATIQFGPSVTSTAYLWLAVSNSAAAAAAGKYAKNLRVRGFKIIKSRTGAFAGFQGTINVSSVENVTIEDNHIIGSAGTDSAISGTNSRRVTVRHNKVTHTLKAFDISNWSSSVIHDNYINPLDTTDAVDPTPVDPLQGINHFWDPVTAPYSYLEAPLAFVQAHNLRIIDNELIGHKNSISLSSCRDSTLSGNTIRDASISTGTATSGILVYTDADQFAAGHSTSGIKILDNKVFNQRNTGGAGYHIGIRVASGSGARPVYGVWIDGNSVYDNANRGITIDTGSVDVQIGRNDFTSRDSSGVQTIDISVNYAEPFGSGSGAVGLRAAGASTNIDVDLLPKGTGKVRAAGPLTSDGLITATKGLSSGSVTLADDTATSITPPALYGKFIGTVSNGITGNAEFHFNVQAGSVVLSSPAASATVGTAALAGTTGTDVKMNYSAVSDGKIYIENRTGSTKTVFYTFIGD